MQKNKIIPKNMATPGSMDTFIENSTYCSICKKYWRIDPYCPHPFDFYEAQRLIKRSKGIQFYTINDKEVIEFFDEKDSVGRLGFIATPDDLGENRKMLYN